MTLTPSAEEFQTPQKLVTITLSGNLLDSLLTSTDPQLTRRFTPHYSRWNNDGMVMRKVMLGLVMTL